MGSNGTINRKELDRTGLRKEEDEWGRINQKQKTTELKDRGYKKQYCNCLKFGGKLRKVRLMRLISD